MKHNTRFRFLLAAATALSSVPAMAQGPAAPAEVPSGSPNLEQGLRNPPQSARPRVWWHWMNANITKEGIAKDIAWMKRIGIGGLQAFDASLFTPRLMPKPLIYMTPEWKDAFRHAAALADREGLELAIAASPGWSETGGPWVKPEDAMKKLVWTETAIVGGRRFAGKLPAPPAVAGPYLALPKGSGLGATKAWSYYADALVLAFPATPGSEVPAAHVTGPDGKSIDYAQLTDDDLQTSVKLPAGDAQNLPAITLTYATPRTIQSATVLVPGAKGMIGDPTIEPRLEASNDGRNWRPITTLEATEVPTTSSFTPVTARTFRVIFAPRQGWTVNDLAGSTQDIGLDNSMMALFNLGGGSQTVTVSDLRLSEVPKVDRFQQKAGFALASDYYALSANVGETAGIDPAKVINLTGRMGADGWLDWTPPKGNWRVVRFGYSPTGATNHPAPKEATGLEVDKYSGEAVRRYLDHYLGMYRDAAGPELIGARGVRALLTDSTEVGPSNWTPRMVEQFIRLRGYDPTPWLPAMTGVIVGSRAKTDAFLYDFRRTLADLHAEEHYGTVAKVAHENGLKVYGEALEDKRPVLGDDMAMRRYTDIPMSAIWTYARGTSPRVTLLADMKGAASVAHIYGQNIVGAESLTGSGTPWRSW